LSPRLVGRITLLIFITIAVPKSIRILLICASLWETPVDDNPGISTIMTTTVQQPPKTMFDGRYGRIVDRLMLDNMEIGRICNKVLHRSN
jgi:hypothetical protein